MPISVRTRTILWGLAASRCSFSQCRRQLVDREASETKKILIGECAHIVAEKEDGPRGKSALTPHERDQYENLILLCLDHHKIIDDDPAEFSVEKLLMMKTDHEKWVGETLSIDRAKIRDETYYASVVDEFIQNFEIDSWEDWASGMATDMGISVIRFERLRESKLWLFKRVWPGRHPELERAFRNFADVFGNLLDQMQHHSKVVGKDHMVTERFYKLIWHEDQSVYESLIVDYETHLGLIELLVYEATCAANYVCLVTRQLLDPSFRLKEGVLVIHNGEGETKRLEYSPEILKAGALFPGVSSLEKRSRERAIANRKN